MLNDRRGVVAVLGSYAPSLILFRGKLIEALVGRGYSVFAMAPAIDGATADQLRAIGATPVSLGRLSNQSLNPLGMAASVAELARLFRRLRPGTVIAYTVKPVTLGAIAARLARVPRFVPLITGLGYAFIPGAGLKRRLARTAATLLYRHALAGSAAVIFQNPDDRDFFRRRRMIRAGQAATVVGGSGIDLDRFAPVPLPAEPRFLMVSRLLGDKGVREYLAAGIAIKRRHPGVAVRLVGYFDQSPDSIGRDELDAAMAQGIEYLGRMDDVRPAIAEASIYVLPSYHEGTPRSVLEAMAMGRPVITTDVPGCRQTVVEGDNGFLVPARNADALEAAMRKFVGQHGLIAPMGVASRRLAEQRFDVHRINAQMFEAAGL